VIADKLASLFESEDKESESKESELRKRRVGNGEAMRWNRKKEKPPLIVICVGNRE